MFCLSDDNSLIAPTIVLSVVSSELSVAFCLAAKLSATAFSEATLVSTAPALGIDVDISVFNTTSAVLAFVANSPSIEVSKPEIALTKVSSTNLDVGTCVSSSVSLMVSIPSIVTSPTVISATVMVPVLKVLAPVIV